MQVASSNHEFLYLIPSAPQNFSLSLNGTVMTATWDAPASGNVTNYTLICSVDGNQVLSVTTTATEVTLGVYLFEKTYSCSILASDTDGSGVPTASVTVTTGGNVHSSDASKI